MRRKHKLAIHILEGHTGGPDSKRLTACNRELEPYRLVIGRAVILDGKRHDEVTCRFCRKAYNLPERP